MDEDDIKVIQLSDEDLINAGFLGDDAFESVKLTINTTRANPELLAECQSLSIQQKALNPPISPALSNSAALVSQPSITSDALTNTAPYFISEFERVYYWHGISINPPELLYRSDLKTNPFPVPFPGTRWSQLPIKTAQGVFKTPLNAVWHTVAPMIVALFKKHGIKYSALKTVRFSTCDEDGKKTLGPIVIWIATHPNTTSAENAHDASLDILHILEDYQVKGAVVEWYEGSVEKFLGPALIHVTDKTNPTYYVRRPFTAALGMPIATKEREKEDFQGTVSFFFHENKDKKGKPSDRVFAISNKHVLCANTTMDYQFKSTGVNRQYIRVCGFHRFQHSLDETRALVANNIAEAVHLTEEIVRLKAKPKSKNLEQAEEDDDALEIRKNQLKKVNKDNTKLQVFFKEISTQWNDIACRNIGFVDWAPSISINVDDCHYTRDIGTVKLDLQKFKDNFQGNVVELGNKFTSHQLSTMFWPNNSNLSKIKFPSNGLLRIQGVVTHKLLAAPDCYDKNGDPVYIVGKNGSTTDFTVGHYAGLEAYLCDKFGKESVEVAVYNYSIISGNFSEKGDSGSLIFTGDGRMLAILHSGMPKGLSNHVTYGTPAWWVIEQLKAHYPHADFNCTTF